MDQTELNAEKLESLLPRIMRTLFRPGPEDPIIELPIAQLRLLRVLHNTCLSGTEICSELHISPSSFSQLARRLEESGLITFHVDESDRRIKRYSLTEVSAEFMERRKRARRANALKALSALSPTEQEEVMRSLAVLLDACHDSLPAEDEGALQRAVEIFIPQAGGKSSATG